MAFTDSFSLLSIVILMSWFNSAYGDITVHTRISASRRLHITCEATGLYTAQSIVHLACPLSDTGLCYANCSAPCLYVNGDCEKPDALKAIEGCTFTRRSRDHVTLDYILNSELVRTAGRWSCMFHGKNSRTIFIEAAEPLPMTTVTTTTTKKPKHVYVYPKFPDVLPKDESNSGDDKWAQKPPRDQQGDKPRYIYDNQRLADENPRPARGTRNDKLDRQGFWFTITRPELVLALLGILSFSLLVNIVFCIRCVLIKRFIDNLRMGNRKQDCLENLLCLDPDPYQKLKKTRTAQQRGLRQESVYEDMTMNGSHRSGPSGHSKTTSSQFEGDDGLMLPHHWKMLPPTPHSGGTLTRKYITPMQQLSYDHSGYYLPSSNGRSGYVVVTDLPPQPPSHASSTHNGDAFLQMSPTRSTTSTPAPGPIYAQPPIRRPRSVDRLGEQANHSLPSTSTANRVASENLSVRTEMERPEVQSLRDEQPGQQTRQLTSPDTLPTQQENGLEDESATTVDLIQHCSKSENRLDMARNLLLPES